MLKARRLASRRGAARVDGGRELINLPLTGTYYREYAISNSPEFPPRYFHTALHSPSSPNTVIVFGGYNGTEALSDLWSLDVVNRVWTRLHPGGSQAPDARFAHCSVFLPNGCMMVFGGANSSGVCLADAHKFDFATKTWSPFLTHTPPPPPPPPRSREKKANESASAEGEAVSPHRPSARRGASAVCYENSVVVLFGGSDGVRTLNDLYELDLKTMTWRFVMSRNAPVPRCYHSAHIWEDCMYVYGGSSDGSQFLFDEPYLHAYHVATRNWSIVGRQSGGGSPSHLQGHAAALLSDALFIVGRDIRTKVTQLFEFSFLEQRWFATAIEDAAVRHWSAACSGGSVGSEQKMLLIGGVDDMRESSNQIQSFVFQLEEEMFDLLDDANSATLPEDDLPKSEWEAAAMKRLPEVLEMRERLRAIDPSIVSYSRDYYVTTYLEKPSKEGDPPIEKERVEFPPTTENREALSSSVVLQLILEHLEFAQKKKTMYMLQAESGVYYCREDDRATESRLSTLLRIARKRLPKRENVLFDPTLADDFDNRDPDHVVVTDHLAVEDTANDVSDVNVWKEPPESSVNILRNDKSELRAANLNKLIELLIPHDKPPNAQFQKVFLLTYQSFTSPLQFLRKVLQRSRTPHYLSEADVKYVRSVALSMVLTVWVVKNGSDLNEKCVRELTSFLDEEIASEEVPIATKLRAALSAVKTKKMNTKPHFSTPPPEPKIVISAKLFSDRPVLLEIDEEEVARQLTLVEFSHFVKIQPVEFFKRGWMEEKKKNRSPNLKKYLWRARQISLWIAQGLVTQEKKKRVAHLEKLLKICQHLKIMGNFQSFYSMLGAVFHPAAAKCFSSDKSELPIRMKEIMKEFEVIVRDPSKYRDFFRTANSDSSSVIPHMDSILREILQIETEPDLINNLINWQKRARLHDVIAPVVAQQNTPYNLQPVLQIQWMFEVDKFQDLLKDEMELVQLAADSKDK